MPKLAVIMNELLKDIFEAKKSFNEFKLKFEQFKKNFPKNINDIVMLNIGTTCVFTLFSYACHCYIQTEKNRELKQKEFIFLTLVLKLMMKSGLDVNSPPPTSNYNPLHYAASIGSLSLVQLLCENSTPNLNMLNSDKISAVWIALGKGYENIVIYLLKQPSLDINLTMGCKEKKPTLLHYILGNSDEAVLDEILKRQDLVLNCEMLNNNDPMNELIVTINDIKNKPLMIRSLQKLLAKPEIDPFKSMSDGHCAYSRLFTWKIDYDTEIRAIFEEYYKNNCANNPNYLLDLTTLLPIGLIRGSEYFKREIANYFLTRGHQIKFDVNFKHLGMTALYYASMAGLIDVVMKLIQLGADANLECNGGIPLIPAIEKRHVDIVRILLQETRLEKINKLYCFDAIDKKTNKPTVVQATLLHLAVEVGAFNNVKLLLQKKADPNIQNSDGLIPFATLPKREPDFYSLSGTVKELEEKFIYIELVNAGIQSKLPAKKPITKADVEYFLIKKTEEDFLKSINQFLGLLIGKYITDKNYLRFFYKILKEHPSAFSRFKGAVEKLAFSDVKKELSSLFKFFENQNTVFEEEDNSTAIHTKKKRSKSTSSNIMCWGLALEKPKKLPAKWFGDFICSDSSAIIYIGRNHYFYFAEKALMRQGCTKPDLNLFRNRKLQFGENVTNIPGVFLQEFLIDNQPYRLMTTYLFSCEKSTVDLIIYKWKEGDNILYIAAGSAGKDKNNGNYHIQDPIVINSEDLYDEVVDQNNNNHNFHN